MMMRITDKISNGTFLSNNQRLRSNLLGSYTRIMTQRRFNRVSEDSINGAKAMIIRRDLRDLDIYDSNLSSAKQLFTEAESNLTDVASKNYIQVKEILVASSNGTYSQMELDSYATALDQIAEQMVKTMNADFSDRQIFGGTNNSSPPFEIGRYCITNEGGDVVYPPYYYDYYVGADATQKQVAQANDDIAKLAQYNIDGVEDMNKDELQKEVAAMQENFKKLNLQLTVNEDNQYKVTAIADNGKGDEIEILSYQGDVKTVSCDVGEKDGETTVAVSAGGIEITPEGNPPKENDVKSHFVLTDVPRSVTYNGIPVDFDVMHKMTDANGNKFDIQLGEKFTVKALNDDFTWGEEMTIAPDVEAAVKGRDNSLIFPGSESIYIDIGIGIKYDKDNDYKIDPQTAMDIAFNGASITGCGLDSEGYSKNLMQLALDAARSLRKGDQSTVNAIIDKADMSNDNVLTAITTIGSKQNSIEFYVNRNEDSRFNLRERQNIVEGTDMETEISYWESLMAAYEASLKVGTQVIPNSIFNYI
ncbi:MAG: hypothetical protein K2J76_04590 [Oscillospiraceae bacterium]|nr:hypothetical protein [Oscillospiraceae bacterium]